MQVRVLPGVRRTQGNGTRHPRATCAGAAAHPCGIPVCSPTGERPSQRSWALDPEAPCRPVQVAMSRFESGRTACRRLCCPDDAAGRGSGRGGAGDRREARRPLQMVVGNGSPKPSGGASRGTAWLKAPYQRERASLGSADGLPAGVVHRPVGPASGGRPGMEPRGGFAARAHRSPYSCSMTRISGWAVWSGVLAGYTSICGGTLLVELIDRRTAGFLVLIGSGLQSGTAAYQQALRASSTQREASP